MWLRFLKMAGKRKDGNAGIGQFNSGLHSKLCGNLMENNSGNYIYHRGECNLSVVMEHMQEKSENNGKSDLVFTAYHLRVGKKVIQASTQWFNLYHQRNRKLSKSPMLGLSYASKAGLGYYKKSTRSIRLSARNAKGQCRL